MKTKFFLFLVAVLAFSATLQAQGLRPPHTIKQLWSLDLGKLPLLSLKVGVSRVLSDRISVEVAASTTFHNISLVGFEGQLFALGAETGVKFYSPVFGANTIAPYGFYLNPYLKADKFSVVLNSSTHGKADLADGHALVAGMRLGYQLPLNIRRATIGFLDIGLGPAFQMTKFGGLFNPEGRRVFFTSKNIVPTWTLAFARPF